MATLIYAGREFTIDDMDADDFRAFTTTVEGSGVTTIDTDQGALTFRYGPGIAIAMLRTDVTTIDTLDEG